MYAFYMHQHPKVNLYSSSSMNVIKLFFKGNAVGEAPTAILFF
jgi:hypothetical protein